MAGTRARREGSGCEAHRARSAECPRVRVRTARRGDLRAARREPARCCRSLLPGKPGSRPCVGGRRAPGGNAPPGDGGCRCRLGCTRERRAVAHLLGTASGSDDEFCRARPRTPERAWLLRRALLRDRLEARRPSRANRRRFPRFRSRARRPTSRPHLRASRPLDREIRCDELDRLGERPEAREQLDAVYQATLVLLYRLLFVLYAESREYLPVNASAGYRDHSLRQRIDSLRRSSRAASSPPKPQTSGAISPRPSQRSRAGRRSGACPHTTADCSWTTHALRPATC